MQYFIDGYPEYCKLPTPDQMIRFACKEIRLIFAARLIEPSVRDEEKS